MNKKEPDAPPASEPEGNASIAGFVKSRPENNDHYINQFKKDEWYPAILKAHNDLTAVVPGYNIDQIKEKFGSLRYYISLPEEVNEGARAKAYHIVDRAEAWVDGWEASKWKLTKHKYKYAAKQKK
jgi:hypothetical protein